MSDTRARADIKLKVNFGGVGADTEKKKETDLKCIHARHPETSETNRLTDWARL